MKPILQALLLADNIYRDTKTGKHVIAGTFNKMLLVKDGAKPKAVESDGKQKQVIPAGVQAGSPYVYVSLTEIRGEVNCVLRYVNLDEGRALFQFCFSVKCDNPLETVEVVLPMPMLPHVEGVHAIELLCNDELIGSHRIILEGIKEGGDGDKS